MILPILLIAISPMDSIFAAVEAREAMTAGPHGVIAKPEVRAGDTVTPDTASFYKDSTYMVLRTDTTFDLFCFNPDLRMAKNLHVWPMWHSQAKKISGAWVWITRPKPYSGFNINEAFKDACEQDRSLPCGIFIGAWRLSPPVVTVLHADRDSVVETFGDSIMVWRGR